jgi:hypothetical protein
VKQFKEDFDPNMILSTPQLTEYEQRLAYGKTYRPIIYLLSLANFAIYAQRTNRLNSRNFFLLSVFISYPIAYYSSQLLFGYKKLRQIDSIDRASMASAGLYEGLMKAQQQNNAI